MIFKIIDKIAGEIIEANSKEAMYEELYNRTEEYGVTAHTHRELTEDLADYTIYIERD